MSKNSKSAKEPVKIIITDTHLCEDNIDQNRSIWRQATDYCNDYHVGLVHGGDVWKSRKGQTDQLLGVFREIVNEAENELKHQTQPSIIAITGNHDKTDNIETISFNSQYDSPGFRPVPVSYVERFDTCDIYYLSYFTEGKGIYEEQLGDMVEHLNKKKTNILITHISVNGVRNNDGSEVSTGIDGNLFKKFDTVIVGHYHNKSQVGSNVYYIGSSFPHNYGENNDKGIVLLYSDGSFEYLPTEFKQFHKVEIHVSELDKKLLSSLQTESLTNNVRLIITGKEEELNTIALSNYKSFGFDIQKKSEQIMNSVNSVCNDEVVIYNHESILNAFDDFCENTGILKEEKEQGLNIINQI